MGAIQFGTVKVQNPLCFFAKYFCLCAAFVFCAYLFHICHEPLLLYGTCILDQTSQDDVQTILSHLFCGITDHLFVIHANDFVSKGNIDAECIDTVIRCKDPSNRRTRRGTHHEVCCMPSLLRLFASCLRHTSRLHTFIAQ